MPITLRDFLNFPFNGGRGIRGNQIETDDSLTGASEGLGISEAFKQQERESFSSRYHTGGYRYDRTFFSDEYFAGDTEEIVGVETWNGIVQVCTAEGRIGRLEQNGGPYQTSFISGNEIVLDISRHGDYMFVGTSARVVVLTVNDVAGTATLAHSILGTGIKAVAAPNDHNDRMYVARREGLDLRLERYDVDITDGSLSLDYMTDISISELNTALGGGEPSLANTGQLKALSVFDNRLWVYAQRANDIKIINIDDTIYPFLPSPADTPTVSGGSGSGATIDTWTVSADGAITDITWADAGTGYMGGSDLTITQGTVSATYRLLNADTDNADGLVDFTGKRILSAEFVVNVDGDHEAGRLQDITGATRSTELEIVSSRFVVNLFTQAGQDAAGNYVDDDTLAGSLHDPDDPLAVRNPWVAVNPVDVNDVLIAANVGKPVWWHNQAWTVNEHSESPHDAVITFAEPQDADFGTGHRWRGSHFGSIDVAVSNPERNDVAYSIESGRLERYSGVVWQPWYLARFLGTFDSENAARARVEATTITPKVGLLVAWQGHGAQRVNTYTAATGPTFTYDLHRIGIDIGDVDREIERVGGHRTYLYLNSADVPSSPRTNDMIFIGADVAAPLPSPFVYPDGTALTFFHRGQAFRYDGTNWVLMLDGKYPFLSINPEASELDLILVAHNIGLPVLLQGRIYTVEHVHHDAIDDVITFEDPPANIFGSLYNFRGSFEFTSDVTSPQNNDVIYVTRVEGLRRYNTGTSSWRPWNDSFFLGVAQDEDHAKARVSGSPVSIKTNLVVAWTGSDLRKVATFTAGSNESDAIELVETSLTEQQIRDLIDNQISFVTAGTDGNLRTATADDWDETNGVSRVIGWAHGRLWKIRRNLIPAHAVSATFTEVAGGTDIGGRRWRNYHYQDYLVSSPENDDVYVNRHGFVWRIRTGGSWHDVSLDDSWFSTNNVLRDTYESEAEALQHVSANGQYVGYLSGSGSPSLYQTSAVVTNDEHYTYEWVDAIFDEIFEAVRANSITVEERAAVDALVSRVPRSVTVTLGDFQANIPGYDPANDVGSITDSLPGHTNILVIAFVTTGNISGTDGTNKVYIIVDEGSGVEAYDGAKIIWNDTDENFAEYELEAIAHVGGHQRYLTTTTVSHHPGDGDDAIVNIEDANTESDYDFAFEDHERWIWHRGQLGN